MKPQTNTRPPRKNLKFATVLTVLLILTTICCSCTAAETVKHNVKFAADNFEVLRRITVYNARTDLVVLTLEGYFSISNNFSKELQVTVKTGEDNYKLNYVYLNEYTMYVIEDISGTYTDPYHYSIKFYTPALDVEHQ